MRNIILLDSCIKSQNYHINRIEQYKNGLKSILKYKDFFIDKGFDIIFIDNSIDDLKQFPFIKDLLPNDIKIICKKLNKNGPNKAGGVIEHWLMSKDIWKDYDYLIHLEIRQILIDNSFFEEFLKDPISIFGWGSDNRLIKGLFPYGKFKKNDKRFEIDRYNRHNRHNRHSNKRTNDFYTGLMSLEIKSFLPFIENYDYKSINEIIPDKGPKSLEKIIMSFAYDNLENFKVIEKLNIKRYSSYDNLDKFDNEY